MQFRVLGCDGSEFPNKRTCSFLAGESVLFDAGSVASAISLDEQSKLRHVFLSHCHLDHVKDLCFLVENTFMGLQQPLEIWGAAEVLQGVRDHLFNDQIWPDFTKLPNVKEAVCAYKILEDGQKVEVEGLKIQAVKVDHAGPALAYLVQGPKGTIVYCCDSGPTDAIWQLVNQCNDLVAILMECSFPNRLDELAQVSKHLTPARLAAEIDKIDNKKVPIHVYHLKAPYLTETLDELKRVGNSRIHLLNAGDTLRSSDLWHIGATSIVLVF